MLGDRYVALMDILGFKEIVQDRPLLDTVRRVDFIFNKVATTGGVWGTFGDDAPISGTTIYERAQFSDTLLVWTKPIASLDEIHRHFEVSGFFFVVTQIMFHAFLARIPLRVGVAYGESYIDKSKGIFLGPAIVDAYLTESAQEWVGGALHPSCLPMPIFHDFFEYIVPYQVPTKPECHVSFEQALNWPAWAPLTDADPESKRLRGFPLTVQMKKAFTWYLGLEISNRDHLRYVQAEAFAKSQIERQQKLQATLREQTNRLMGKSTFRKNS